jgi:superfamily I DNA/RNA helicase
MDKRVMLAVAGSGKTTFIINKLSLERRSLIVTYTLNNITHIRKSIIRKFGYLPPNIRVISYFSFLHGFCYKPFLARILPSKGIQFRPPHSNTLKLKRNKISFYRSASSRLYNNRIARLLEEAKILTSVNARLEKYYDDLFIDEIQDFAGHDYNLLKSIAGANISMLFVGDFYQHTFDTSSDGNVNMNLHGDYNKYIKEFKKMGLEVDTTTLVMSHRCSPSVCSFIRDRLGISIESTREDVTEVKLIADQAEALQIFQDNRIVKLFYMEHYRYGCYSSNWGSSKGLDHFTDVCVVLNKKTFEQFENGDLSVLTPTTKNKLYVACSRARGNLYFISDELFSAYKSAKEN